MFLALVTVAEKDDLPETVELRQGRVNQCFHEKVWGSDMLFNSYVFIFGFFPIVLLGYYFFNKIKMFTLAKIFLFCSSLYFYAYFKKSYLFLIIISILVNYVFSIFFERIDLVGMKRKILLIVALLFNLGIIGYYKYYDFFVENINLFLKSNIPLLNVLLPLGISFFTFQQLSFVIDCYKRETTKYKLLDYALFVTYFPQLIAGPIVTHDELVPQIASKTNKSFNSVNFSKGLMAFSYGIGKKVLIADTFGNAVNWGYANITGLSSSDALLIMLGYTFQIYFDFSGYCDMATGIGLMMNIELPQNFNSPYRAFSITEFWKRWHMTLTRFFTRYIYIPLGGNRKGVFRTCVNVFLVYLCSGIWHGANWTFIFWGVAHGCACIIDRLTKKYTDKWHPVIRWLLTFGFINVAWVFFRADSIEQALLLLKKIGEFQFFPVQEGIYSVFYSNVTRQILSWMMPYDNAFISSAQPALFSMGCYFVFAWISSINIKNTNERIENFKPSVIYAVMVSLIFCYSILSLSGVSTFLYFNF